MCFNQIPTPGNSHGLVNSHALVLSILVWNIPNIYEKFQNMQSTFAPAAAQFGTPTTAEVKSQFIFFFFQFVALGILLAWFISAEM